MDNNNTEKFKESYDVPVEYSKEFILPYNRNNEVNDELINTTDELMEIQNNYIYDGDDKIIGKPTVRYNPLFSPSDLIDHAIHVERYKPKNKNGNGNGEKKSEKKYDPYLNYLKQRGLSNDSSELRYKLAYINIDSANRKKEPYNIFGETYNLIDNPLSIIGTNTLRININNKQVSNNNDNNKSFYIGQKIAIEGVQPLQKKYKYTSDNLLIEFTNSSPNVDIKLNANLNISPSNYKFIDTSKMFVELANIEGNDLSSYIGNIPISLLNKKHQIYLYSDISNNNLFYIKLPFNSNGVQATTTFYLSVSFYHYNTIPINEINADYPINDDHINGYHIIKTITDNYVEAILYPPYVSSENYNNFGGNKVYLNTIKSVSNGYPNSHTYTIKLPEAYSNIVQVNMISSIFPNVFKEFKAYPSSQQNNILYFQDVDNGDEIQIIELEEGTYTDEQFIKRMEYKFTQVKRTNDIANSSYSPYYYVKINIEKNRDYIEFNNYRIAYLPQPILAIVPSIASSDTSIGIGTYIIVIKHINHNITEIGTEIELGGFISHLGISASDLNKKHKITNILDENTYEIQLTNINLEIIKTTTAGGFGCYILVPRLIRFLFSYQNSMGEQFGFRNIGDIHSITVYSTTITNKTLYENETTFDALRNKKIFTNKSLTFYKDQYIIMTCKQLSIIKNTTNPIDIFAKINFTKDEVLVDEIICPPKFYYNPINRLSELTFEFYTPDGKQFDFNNIDHSFVLELTMMDNIPENTGLLSNNSNAR